MNCSTCQGNGELDCPHCFGEGKFKESQDCHHCKGWGCVDCPRCCGNGRVD